MLNEQSIYVILLWEIPLSYENLKNKTVILPGKKSLGMAGNYKIQDKEVTGKPLANPTNTAEEFHFYGEEGGNWGRLF